MKETAVLLVDTNRDFLQVTFDLLHRAEDVVVVGTIVNEGEDVLHQCRALEPQIVLVSMDGSSLAGLKLLSYLHVVLSGVKVIALTMLEGEVFRETAILAGADEVIAKANVSTELLPAIRRLGQPSI